ncbi:hypothetical protein C8R45DRAFT_463516 [Mycena sanguinolenta]|nr:hypothetical protein C8R45DRAFT_463516 [Mycena sanguinolenta]
MSNEAWRSMPIPATFVFGFALTPDQLRTVVHKWLPGEITNQLEGDHSYHAALVEYFRNKRYEWTVLHTRSGSGEHRFLWVTQVVPIWDSDGTVPELLMPAKNFEQLQSTFGLTSLETMCQRWPPGMTPPEWLMRKIIARGKEICETMRTKV